MDVTPGSRASLERTLRQADVEPSWIEGLRGAIDKIRQETLDAVVCELRGRSDGPELIRWLGGRTPSTPVVIVTADPSDEFVRAVSGAPNVRVIRELDPARITQVLTEIGPKRGFFGNSIEIELFDYVQMIALTGRDKLIEVRTPQGVGLIWFEHGDIVHAEYRELKGEPAFYRLLSVGVGEFSEDFGRPPPMRSVTRSSTHLLMEAARQADEGILGQSQAHLLIEPDDSEASFADLNEALADPDAGEASRTPSVVPLRPSATDNEEEDFAALMEDDLLDEAEEEAPEQGPPPLQRRGLGPSDSQLAVNTMSGHTIFDDPDMRQVMLEQFWQFDGINGVAIISSTGKVLAEDMRNNSSLVTLAGFYMRGAARIARALGHNVFDGVVARSINGQQMVMISMGAASAVLSVAPGADPEAVRDAVMGVD